MRWCEGSGPVRTCSGWRPATLSGILPPGDDNAVPAPPLKREPASAPYAWEYEYSETFEYSEKFTPASDEETTYWEEEYTE